MESRHQNVIPDDSDASIANVFCFGAFADKRTGVMYNDMTGNFPFVSLDGNVCYLIIYHYDPTVSSPNRSLASQTTLYSKHTNNNSRNSRRRDSKSR